MEYPEGSPNEQKNLPEIKKNFEDYKAKIKVLFENFQKIYPSPQYEKIL